MDTAIIALISAVAVAVITSGVNIITNRLNRKDAKEDKRSDEHSELMETIKSINSKIDCIRHKVGEMDSKSEEREAKAARNRILRFGDELYQDIRHSKDMFDMILLDIDFYEKYCDTHKDFENSITVMTVEKIRETYRACSESHSFL